MAAEPLQNLCRTSAKPLQKPAELYERSADLLRTEASATGQRYNEEEEEAAAQTQEELEVSLTAARDLEAQEGMRFVQTQQVHNTC